MPLDRRALLDFLSEVEKELDRRIVLVAVGGTAMTLLGAKESTIDVDFTGPGADVAAFKAVLKSLPHGFKVDTWPEGQVFSQFLPDDYLSRSSSIKAIGNIELRALHPVDIIVTKAGRLDERDMEDIEACIKKFHPTKREVAARANQVTYVGREENFRHNIQVILQRLFPRNKGR